MLFRSLARHQANASRMISSRAMVSTTDTRSEPRQPRRLEKNRNTRASIPAHTLVETRNSPVFDQRGCGLTTGHAYVVTARLPLELRSFRCHILLGSATWSRQAGPRAEPTSVVEEQGDRSARRTPRTREGVDATVIVRRRVVAPTTVSHYVVDCDKRTPRDDE